jgi:hypothetical protein
LARSFRHKSGGALRLFAAQARPFAAGGQIPDSYWRLGRRWAICGVIATIIPLCNLYFMIFKP